MLNTKRSIITLFSDSSCPLSHQVRFILALKGVTYETIEVNSSHKPPEFFEISPEGAVPTFLDRDIVISDIRILSEYLDDRFPYLPLMPVYPAARAKTRLILSKIEKEWGLLLQRIASSASAAEMHSHVKELGLRFKEIIPFIQSSPYFLGDEFSLIDCWLAPIVWRFEYWGVQLTPSETKVLKSYEKRLFSMEAFRASLTEAEMELRKYVVAEAS